MFGPLLSSLLSFAPPATADEVPVADDAVAPIDLDESGSDDDDEDDEDDEDEDESAAEGPASGEEDPACAIFGCEEDLEEMEELPAEGESDGATSSQGVGSRLPGDLRVNFGILSSIYFDLDGPVDGRRWNRDPKDPDAEPFPIGQIGRNENRLEAYVYYSPNEHITIAGGIEPVFMGVSQASSLNDLATRQMVRPFHVESDRAYVQIKDLVKNVDIKVGRQIVAWGTADKFNPTNNINADDFEDRPLFMEPIANQMAVVDWHPLGDGRLGFQAVYVPLFYPALLPPSAADALANPESPVPFGNQDNVDQLRFLQGFLRANIKFVPTVVANVVMPEQNLTNGQAAFKVSSVLEGIQMSASYYFGYFDVPLPFRADSTQLVDDIGDEPDEEECCFRTDAYLLYPRMHVFGADFATHVPFLGDMGLWGEAGLFLPDRDYSMRIEFPIALDIPDGEDGNPVRELVGFTAPRQPFLKVTAGADYTIGKHFLVLGQYIRGFVDEFGAGNMGNYLLGGVQFQAWGRRLVAQVFTVVDFPNKKKDPDTPLDLDNDDVTDEWLANDIASAVIAPELALTPKWGFVTFKLGSFAFLARLKDDDVDGAPRRRELAAQRAKFMQSGVGTSIVYAKVQARF